MSLKLQITLQVPEGAEVVDVQAILTSLGDDLRRRFRKDNLLQPTRQVLSSSNNINPRDCYSTEWSITRVGLPWEAQ